MTTQPLTIHSYNMENACIKARRYKLAATRLILFLRTQEFRDSGMSRPTAYPSDLFGSLRKGFGQLYRLHTPYRQTGVVLGEHKSLTGEAP